jgi:hypothetical protein
LSKRCVPVVVALAITAAALGGAAQARGGSSTAALSKTYVLKAVLGTRQEKPAPVGAKGASGVFTAKLTVAGKKSSFVWQLSFKNLSGPAAAAHVHFGVVGKAGRVALPLCGPCKPGAHGAYNGAYVAMPAFLDAVLHGRTYANVHTKKNPGGEIRGQIKVTAA